MVELLLGRYIIVNIDRINVIEDNKEITNSTLKIDLSQNYKNLRWSGF